MWNRLRSEPLSFLASIDRCIWLDHRANPLYLPNLAGSSLLLASDYSGDQRHSEFDTITIVITNRYHWTSWETRRIAVRKQFSLGNRRISYTKLHDRHKADALLDFLEAAHSLVGVAVTLLVDKRLPSFWWSHPVPTRVRETFGFAAWKPAVFERMTRILGLASLFTAGLISEGQDSTWVTDEDSIIANTDRAKQVAFWYRAITQVVALPRIGRSQVLSTSSDSGNLELEDFAALPDLVAGAVTECIAAYKLGDAMPVTRFALPMSSDVPRRARSILRVAFDPNSKLKKLCWIVRFHKTAGQFGISQLTFPDVPTALVY